MNIILLFKEDFLPERDSVLLKGRRLEHILAIHKAKPGDTLQVGLQDGNTGIGKIIEIDLQKVIMDVSLSTKPPPPLPLTLLLALPRPKVLKRVLTSISSMGVKNIFLVNAFRVEKSYWQTPALKEESIEHQLILGLEQAKDTLMPKVYQKKLFKPFVEDELPSLLINSRPLLAHPTSRNSSPHSISEPVVLAIGPEGGFIQYEVKKLKESGFSDFSFGKRILKVETVLPALLGKLFY